MTLKYLAILLGVLWSFLAQPLFAARGSAANCRYYGPGIPSFNSNREMDSREKKDGVGRFIEMPQTYQDAILRDKDFSASTIHELAQKAEAFWRSGGDPTENEFLLKEKLDPVVIAELNLTAADAWNSMVDCNGKDPSAARRNYFMGTPCPQSPQANQESLQKLKTLQQNFVHAAQTMPLILIKHRMFEQHKAAVGVQVTHPLLTQIALQTQLVYAKHHFDDPKTYFTGLNRLAEILTDAAYEGVNFNGTYKESAETIAIGKQMGLPVRSEITYSQTQIEFTHLVLNSLTFTALFVGDQCSEIGLWPALNRSIVYLLWPQNNSSHVLGNRVLSGVLTPMYERVKSSCGSTISEYQYMVLRDQGVYNSTAFLHIAESRRITATYFPGMTEEEKMKKLLRKLSFEENTTPMMAIMCMKK